MFMEKSEGMNREAPARACRFQQMRLDADDDVRAALQRGNDGESSLHRLVERALIARPVNRRFNDLDAQPGKTGGLRRTSGPNQGPHDSIVLVRQGPGDKIAEMACGASQHNDFPIHFFFPSSGGRQLSA